MAAAPATEPMASEGSNFEVVIEKPPGVDFEVIPEEKEEDEIKPDHYYEDGGIPVFKPVSSAARSFCYIILVPVAMCVEGEVFLGGVAKLRGGGRDMEGGGMEAV